MQLRAPKDFASPLHIHHDEDEFFVVLSGEVRVQHGDSVIEAVSGSLIYGPRNVAHAFRVDSAEARLLLFFGPAGVEGFFRVRARWPGLSDCRLLMRSS
ncbi:MAG: hypothetical protein DLM71_00105 [Chloroflexi bacterium]|nr:MAG: hypothetical protein DLM71_00105 [Chloroflexota bacterium]